MFTAFVIRLSHIKMAIICIIPLYNCTNVTLSEIVSVLFEFQIVRDRQISFLVTIMFEAGYNIRGQGDCGL